VFPIFHHIYVDIDPIFSINNITSSTLTTTKLTFNITRITLERIVLCIAFGIC
jgi:hypothetical protein